VEIEAKLTLQGHEGL